MDYVDFLVLGIGTGALYAGLALGIVLAYQGSGVINFAHGAVAMYAAYVYDQLRDAGDYVFPVIGLPARVHLGEVGTPTAFVLTVLTAVVLGVAMHGLVFHPLRRHPLLAKVVASVGVMLTIQTVVSLRFGTGNEPVDPTLPSGFVDLPVLGVRMQQDRLWLTAVVVALAVGLWALYRWTSFGLATRAAAEEEKGAILLGYSPGRLAAVNWILSAVSAALVGMFAAAIAPLNAFSFVLFVIPALAAALVGRLRSFPIAMAAGLSLGMLESMISRMSADPWFPDWLPFTGAQKALPLLVIVAFLAIGGRTLPGRGTLDDGRPPRSPEPRNVGRWTAVLVPAGVAAVTLTSSPLRFSVLISLASAIVLLSMVVLTGFVGQISLAQAVFAGAAGFVTAMLAEGSVPFPISPLIGALAATGVGLLMALPAVRVRGAQLAIVTMAAGISIEELVFKNPSVVGIEGALLVPAPSFAGIDLAANRAPDFNRWEFGVLLVVVLTLTSLAVTNLRRSGTGRHFLAVRANERAAASVGIDVVRTKLLAFAMSSFVAGLGGAMLAYLRGGISSQSFSVFVSLTFLAFAYLGGIGSVSGALVGATLVSGGLLQGLSSSGSGPSDLAAYIPLIAGVALVATAVLAPDGIVGTLRARLDRRREVAT